MTGPRPHPGALLLGSTLNFLGPQDQGTLQGSSLGRWVQGACVLKGLQQKGLLGQRGAWHLSKPPPQPAPPGLDSSLLFSGWHWLLGYS